MRGPCGPGRCIDACAAADGVADDSTASEAFVGTLVTGPSLRGGAGALVVPIHGTTGG